MSNKENEVKTNINWYPGHMAKTRRQIENDLKMIDIVIELLDSRIPISSQNPDIAKIIKGKKKIIVLNKCDLADENQNQLWQFQYRKRNRTMHKKNRRNYEYRFKQTSRKRKNWKKDKSNGIRNSKCR